MFKGMFKETLTYEIQEKKMAKMIEISVIVQNVHVPY